MCDEYEYSNMWKCINMKRNLPMNNLIGLERYLVKHNYVN